MSMSLDELKKKNEEEEEEEAARIKAEGETNSDGKLEEKPEEDPEGEKPDEDPDEGSTGDEEEKPDADADAEDLEDFFETLDEEDFDSADVPVATHIRMKQKLKTKVTETEDENIRLKAENVALKAGTDKLEGLPKRPKAEDFDYDDEKLKAATETYEDEVARLRYNRIQQEEGRKTAVEATKTRRDKAVTDHYKRAEKLVTGSKDRIKVDVYEQAEKTVRDVMEELAPGHGEIVIDSLIEIMGEGSEKVIFLLGKKPEALAEFKSLMEADPSGLQAAMFMGQQKERLTKSKRRTSQARRPAESAEGDGNASLTTTEKALKKRYDAAHKTGDSQVAFDARRKARKAGIDVSTWE